MCWVSSLDPAHAPCTQELSHSCLGWGCCCHFCSPASHIGIPSHRSLPCSAPCWVGIAGPKTFSTSSAERTAVCKSGVEVLGCVRAQRKVLDWIFKPLSVSPLDFICSNKFLLLQILWNKAGSCRVPCLMSGQARREPCSCYLSTREEPLPHAAARTCP